MFLNRSRHVTGVMVTAVGIDAIRHVGRNRETAMAALPVIFGFHQLIEVFVWKGLDGRASAAVTQRAAWAAVTSIAITIHLRRLDSPGQAAMALAAT